jgi:hypothetical protein
MDRFPWVWPLSLGTGARPTRLAAWAWRLDYEHDAVASPRPGMLVRMSKLAQVRVCVAQHFDVFVDRFDLAQPLNELTLVGVYFVCL